jgi:hypothetical protein
MLLLQPLHVFAVFQGAGMTNTAPVPSWTMSVFNNPTCYGSPMYGYQVSHEYFDSNCMSVTSTTAGAQTQYWQVDECHLPVASATFATFTNPTCTGTAALRNGQPNTDEWLMYAIRQFSSLGTACSVSKRRGSHLVTSPHLRCTRTHASLARLPSMFSRCPRRCKCTRRSQPM